MRAKAYGSVLFSGTKIASKPYLVIGFQTDSLVIKKLMLERFMEWNACLLHMFERFT